jgi:hypothetical protein
MKTGLWLLLLTSRVFAAGGVVGEPGSCVIEIGLYTAHFTVYQPQDSGEEEFCEDLPAIGDTVFVLDYLHGSLKEVPVDLRIIRDEEELGIFARWENIEAMEDLEARTEYYQSPVVRPDNQLVVEHRFASPGAYIGVVTAPHPTRDIVYHAVFPFEVGRTSRWPWVVAAVLLGAAAYGWRRRSHA